LAWRGRPVGVGPQGFARKSRAIINFLAQNERGSAVPNQEVNKRLGKKKQSQKKGRVREGGGEPLKHFKGR